MILKDLISDLAVAKVVGDAGIEVRGLAYHSRDVQAGFLFAAIPGWREDGRKYIPEAIDRGAQVLLVNSFIEEIKITQIIVPEVREALARLAATFYDHPSLSLKVIGITGTNGKTTTSYLIESILKEAGSRPGVIGTINYRYQGQVWPAPTTTPESLDLQRVMQNMRAAGVTEVILEVSSHALDMQRVRACHFDVALFTNLTRDHLDYHRSMEDYFRAKQLLFTQYLGESKKDPRFAIVNLDDPRGAELLRVAAGRKFGYGIKKKGDVWPEEVAESPDGLWCRVQTPRGAYEIASSLIGQHNLYNLLAAISVGEVFQIPIPAIRKGLRELDRVPGRLELIKGEEGVRVFIDYAHTEDALARALATLRQIYPGRLLVVFGCGGDRDKGKRAKMGQVAAWGSDLAIVTSDNPRTEDPLAIISEIEEGLRVVKAQKHSAADLLKQVNLLDQKPHYVIIPDRREAIDFAIRLAQPNDVVLIAGKGHENYQIIGPERIHFDDREEAERALGLKKERKNL